MNKLNIGQKVQKLRDFEDLSLTELENLTGITRQTLARIERGESNVTIEKLAKIADFFQVDVKTLFDEAIDPEIIVETQKERPDTDDTIRISIPQKNYEKFKEVFLYILNQVGSKPNIGKTVIYKLLYFIDFDYYERYEEQIIGATYQKNKFGPTPMEFRKVLNDMIADEEISQIDNKYFTRDQKKYLPLRFPDLAKLSAKELQLIDKVLARLSDKDATQISNYSHEDIPWLTTNDGDIIPYESVFYRTERYSVRNYSEVA